MKIYDYNGKKNICGERIREARLKQRLSQSDLAARVQVEGVIMERDSISRVEIGTRFVPDDEAFRQVNRCGTRVTGDATSGLTPLLHQFTLNSTWLLRSAPSLTGCFL